MEKIYIITNKQNQVRSQYFFETFEAANQHIKFYKMFSCEVRSLFSDTKNPEYKCINVGPEPKI